MKNTIYGLSLLISSSLMATERLPFRAPGGDLSSIRNYEFFSDWNDGLPGKSRAAFLDSVKKSSNPTETLEAIFGDFNAAAAKRLQRDTNITLDFDSGYSAYEKALIYQRLVQEPIMKRSASPLHKAPSPIVVPVYLSSADTERREKLFGAEVAKKLPQAPAHAFSHTVELDLAKDLRLEVVEKGLQYRAPMPRNNERMNFRMGAEAMKIQLAPHAFGEDDKSKEIPAVRVYWEGDQGRELNYYLSVESSDSKKQLESMLAKNPSIKVQGASENFTIDTGRRKLVLNLRDVPSEFTGRVVIVTSDGRTMNFESADKIPDEFIQHPERVRYMGVRDVGEINGLIRKLNPRSASVQDAKEVFATLEFDGCPAI